MAVTPIFTESTRLVRQMEVIYIDGVFQFKPWMVHSLYLATDRLACDDVQLTDGGDAGLVGWKFSATETRVHC